MHLIDDFHRSTDGNDWGPAFRRAIEAFDQSQGFERGGAILFGPREYHFAETIHLDRQVVLRGEGGAGWFGATRLVFAPDKDGIVVHYLNTWAGSPSAVSRGAWSVIENLVIESKGNSCSECHGVQMLGRASLENVYITKFSGNGVRIDASVDRTPKTNANLWRITNVRIDNCGSHGLYAVGTDANAGVAVALDSSSNKGWGVYDASYLGNTYIGAHTANNTLGSYKSDNPNARNLFLNCYAEKDQAAAEVAFPAMVIGGLANVARTSTGVVMQGAATMATFPNGVRSPNDRGDVTDVVGRLGSRSNPNSVLEFAQKDKCDRNYDEPWRLTLSDDDQWWRMQWANLDNMVAFAFSDAGAKIKNARLQYEPVGKAQFWVRTGIWMGTGGTLYRQVPVRRGSLHGIENTDWHGTHFLGWSERKPSPNGDATGDIVWNSGTGPEVGWRFDGTAWTAF